MGECFPKMQITFNVLLVFIGPIKRGIPYNCNTFTRRSLTRTGILINCTRNIGLLEVSPANGKRYHVMISLKIRLSLK